MKRILVYGVTGSGKTLLAQRIGERLGLPVHLVDELTWEPGWMQVPGDEQRRRIEAICAGERWVLDSAYGAWLDVPLARVELIVALDYPRLLSFGRLLRRSLNRARDRHPVCNGNIETWRLMLSRDSILLWHFKSFRRKRERIRHWEATLPPEKVVRLTHPRQVDPWLESVAGKLPAHGEQPGNPVPHHHVG